ncbi:MAG: hypothetical protein WED09_05465 [Homoserinimonas sp.]
MRKRTAIAMGAMGLRVLKKSLNPALQPVNLRELGGTARLDARRPIPWTGFAKAGRWAGFTFILPGLLCLSLFFPGVSYSWLPWDATGWWLLLIVLGLPFVSVEGWLLLVLHRLAVFVLRQKKENSEGLVQFALSRGRDPWWMIFISLILATLIVRLLAAGAPESVSTVLNENASWLFLMSAFSGVIAAIRLALKRSASLKHEYEGWKLHQRRGTLAALTGGRYTSVPPELHDILEFEPDFSFALSETPPYVAEHLRSFEMTLTKQENDDWMLDETVESPIVRVTQTTSEKREERELLRRSDFRLVRIYEREVDYNEILGFDVALDVKEVNPDATNPRRPQPALIAEHVTEKDLSQIQRFAVEDEDRMTIVGYDLERWNSAKRRHENLVYLQRVDAEEAAVIQQVANRIAGGNAHNVWLEFHWVPNDGHNADVCPRHLEAVVVLRSPKRGLTEDEQEKTWRSVMEFFPGWTNGTIEAVGVSSVVILRYAKPLALPALVRTIDLLPPKSADPMRWAKNAYGVNPVGEAVMHDLSKVPNLLIAGKPGTGKSALARHILAMRLALGHKVIVLDHEKKAAFARPFKSRTLIWATENRAIANALAFAHQDALRKYTVIRSLGYENWYDATTEERKRYDLYPVSIFFDEFENAIAPKDVKTAEAAFGKGSKRYESDLRFNAAIGLIQDYTAKLGKVDRAAGTYLVIMTQFPYQEKLKDVRNALGMSIQMAATGTTLKANEVGLTLGPDASEGIELLNKFITPFPGQEPQVGVGAMQDTENGGLTAFKAPWLGLDEVEEFLSLAGVPEVQPWRITDQLGVGLRAEEEPDLRTPIEPPFGQTLSHLDEEEEGDVIDLYSASVEPVDIGPGGNAHLDGIPLPSSDEPIEEEPDEFENIFRK